MKVIYKKKIYELITPKELKFPPNTIRNIHIRRGNIDIITNLKEVKILKDNFKDLTNFF